jgi:hypothetical protein
VARDVRGRRRMIMKQVMTVTRLGNRKDRPIFMREIIEYRQKNVNTFMSAEQSWPYHDLLMTQKAQVA